MITYMENRVQSLEDTFMEILVYLPVKSLMRFKCVSKDWYALIKSPSFLTKHLKRDCKEIMLLRRYLPLENSPNIRRGGEDILSFHNPDSLDFLVLPNLSNPFSNDMEAPDYVHLFGPCNGIVCLTDSDINIFCNPALREFKLLSPSPFACPEVYVPHHSGSGFGFDIDTNAYKLVHIWHMMETTLPGVDEEDTYMSVELYDSSTSSWRIIDEVVPDAYYNHGFDIYFNDSCHWQAIEFTEGPPPMGMILAFDVRREVFQKFEYPDCFDGKSPSLTVLNQCLALVRYVNRLDGDGPDEPNLVDIWLMKEYGMKDSWVKEFVIGPYLFRQPFLCWRNKWLMVETKDKLLGSCALHKNEMKRFQFHGLKQSFRCLFFKESLTSLNEVSILVKKD